MTNPILRGLNEDISKVGKEDFHENLKIKINRCQHLLTNLTDMGVRLKIFDQN